MYEIADRVREILESKQFRELAESALSENGWFTHRNILRAVDAIRNEMLDHTKIEQWMSRYDIPEDLIPRRVGIVMAGNIPLVGFFDLFCTLIVGHEAIVKLSSKDSVLMGHVVRELGARVVETLDGEPIDLMIATGGDSAAEYYTSRFSHIPSIVRGHRHSVAIITPLVSDRQLALLTDDMFLYHGLGCRNVSRIYLPVGYDPGLLPNYVSKLNLFDQSYRYHRALYTMQNLEFIDKGGYILLADPDGKVQPPVAVVTYTYYDRIEEIELDLGTIQCIVGVKDELPWPSVEFGCSQKPSLTDYADSKDLIKFLINQ